MAIQVASRRKEIRLDQSKISIALIQSLTFPIKVTISLIEIPATPIELRIAWVRTWIASIRTWIGAIRNSIGPIRIWIRAIRTWIGVIWIRIRSIRTWIGAILVDLAAHLGYELTENAAVTSALQKSLPIRHFYIRVPSFYSRPRLSTSGYSRPRSTPSAKGEISHG